MSLTKALQWRYATKRFDPEKKIPQQEFNELMEAARLAPSSYGLQPWKFIVVNDKNVREQLKAVAWNQAQITDASHLVVLCARTDVDAHLVKAFIKDIAKTRKATEESLKGYEDMMLGFVNNITADQRLIWSQKQVYIALGFLLTAAAEAGIDACPMEGFSADDFDKILGLKEKQLRSTVICTLGYRSADDSLATAAKVRSGDVIITV